MLISNDQTSLQQPLLMNKKYFNLSKAEATSVSS